MSDFQDYPCDIFKEGFAPPGGYVKDFSIVRYKGMFHLYFTEGKYGQSCAWPGNEIAIGHASSPDLVSWSGHPPALTVNPESWDSAQVYAPYVFVKNDKLLMFYTGHDNCLMRSERLGLAISNDSNSFVRNDDKPVFEPRFDWCDWSQDQTSSCRDPHILFHDNCYWLYYTCGTEKGQTAVGLAATSDLVHFEDCGPVCSAAVSTKSIGHIESSCVHEVNGKWFFSVTWNGSIWYCVGNRHDRFDSEYLHMLWPGYYGLEVIHKDSDQWLVSAFKGGELKLKLARLALMDNSSRITVINSSTELERTYGNSKP